MSTRSHDIRPSPTDPRRFIGIELEFMLLPGFNSRTQTFNTHVYGLLKDALKSSVGAPHILTGSAHQQRNSCEIGVLLPQSSYRAPLQRMLRTIASFPVECTTSFGTHIHMDARPAIHSGGKVDLFNRLSPHLEAFKSLCSEIRINGGSFGSPMHASPHYDTVEIRVFDGTTSFARMCRFVDACISIASPLYQPPTGQAPAVPAPVAVPVSYAVTT